MCYYLLDVLPELLVVLQLRDQIHLQVFFYLLDEEVADHLRYHVPKESDDNPEVGVEFVTHLLDE